MSCSSTLSRIACAFGVLALGGCGGSGTATSTQESQAGTTPTPTPTPTNLPYSIPAVGQAVAIGVNTADSIRPPGYGSTSWAYSLFNSYGVGSFVPDYSPAGAFVIAATGGHRAPGNVDAAIFDFSDETWKRRANANGITPREADYAVSETNGAPYYELLGSTAGQIPSPVHLMQASSYIPAALGGGSKGSFLKMGSSAVAIESRLSGGIHRMDLATGLWTRVTNDLVKFDYSYVSSTVFDPLTKRYYQIHDAFHVENSVQFLDANDWRMKRTPTFPNPAGWQGSGYQTVFLDPVRRLLIAQRLGFPMRALDLNNFAAGWVTLNMAGTQPAEPENRWVYFEPDGRFYTRGNNTGQTLSRLTPPTGDWKTGVWSYSQVSVGGASMPNFTNTGGQKQHFGMLFYVPALMSMAWIAGEAAPVIIMRPPA